MDCPHRPLPIGITPLGQDSLSRIIIPRLYTLHWRLFRPTVPICSWGQCIIRTCYQYNYLCNARPDYWLYFSSAFCTRDYYRYSNIPMDSTIPPWINGQFPSPTHGGISSGFLSDFYIHFGLVPACIPIRGGIFHWPGLKYLPALLGFVSQGY